MVKRARHRLFSATVWLVIFGFYATHPFWKLLCRVSPRFNDWCIQLRTAWDKNEGPIILIRVRFNRRKAFQSVYWVGFVYSVGAGIYLAFCGSWLWVSAMFLLAALSFASATRPAPKKGGKP